jgi:RNA 3'-terminal phosphate cyclase (ATP)|uniref:RNA 3'-terminal phosphate cyclase n=1 Tax=Desulfobacca acetoxidans TaxID=60893 RepID=A0A7V6DP01_9BACT
MLHLDGAYGEGGGQLVRTSLSLAVLLGEPVRITDIRAGRAKPGLRPQHLTGVKALAHISGAEVEGAALGSRELTFKPRIVKGGDYFFDVAEKTGSAGSVTLVAQALLPPLLAARKPTSLTIRGGTHVAWSPPAHYLMHVFLPALAAMGGLISLTLTRWGWYPRGGGEIRLTVPPVARFAPQRWLTPPDLADFQALSAASRVPYHVIQRQATRLQERLGSSLPVAREEAVSLDPGSFVFLWGPLAGFSALGARGKPAEQVADEAVEEFLGFQTSRAALDRHLADQIVLYLARAAGTSVLVTEEITSHLITNLWVIEQFLGPTFQVQGNLGERGEITCQGRG